MPDPCTFLLEVFRSALDYDLADEVVDWEVSTDRAHSFPYLMAPRNYGEQEIDPVTGGAHIGQVEVGVIDVHQTPGDQTTGWMTERVHNVLGRRCRLSRYVDETIGWVVIGDGPASAPRMDPSYSAYRWTIRDTRETERRTRAFMVGGTTAIIPRGSVYGWGLHETDDGPDYLLPPVAGISGTFQTAEVGPGRLLGYVTLEGYGIGNVLEDENLIMTEEGEKALATSETASGAWVTRNADILWRLLPDDPWNVARLSSPFPYQWPIASVIDATLDGETVRALREVYLFHADEIPEGFPEVGETVEIVLRYRGPASDDFPYYYQGTQADLLQALYDGELSSIPAVEGLLYDPADMEGDNTSLLAPIRYDPTAFADMTGSVLLRAVEPVEDARDWAEAQVYGPSGWIPTLDNAGRISPLRRNRPTTTEMVGATEVNNANAEPSPSWDAGERVVTSVTYNYKRYFIPDSPAVETEPDGLAVRDVTVGFQDGAAELVHGPHPEEFDASVFSAVGDEDGDARAGDIEPGNLLAQEARFEVLARYRNAAQSFGVAVQRSEFPSLRAGQWVPWDLSWLPNRVTGLRGGPGTVAQVLAIKDDDCAWRSLLLEESSVADPPGYASALLKQSDIASAGFADTLELFSDTPGGS